jgi:phage terminase large subunit
MTIETIEYRGFGEAPRTLQRCEWPPNYTSALLWKSRAVGMLRSDRKQLESNKVYYRSRPQEWINHWALTYDPRLSGTGRPPRMPFIMFDKQGDLVEALHEALLQRAALLVEKSRDIGATWVCCAFSVWLWLYWEGVAVAWGSRKKELVDEGGDPKSIFEKIRIILRYLPDVMLPEGFSIDRHATFMKVVNPETGSTITGEIGDNMGRGGRSRIYFLDESAHYEHAESVEAAVSYNTDVPIDISSVNGPGTVFQRKRDAGKLWVRGQAMALDATNVFVFDWSDHPEKTQEWYDNEKIKKKNEGLLHLFAQEVDRDPSASVLGTVISLDHFRAAIGAAQRLGIKRGGNRVAGLDVADGDLPTGDRNALAVREGIELVRLTEWGDRDPGVTTRRALAEIDEMRPIDVEYDCVGVGAGVKSEWNRLVDDKLAPRGVHFYPWGAGSSPLDPEKRVVEGDKESPLNEDMFANLKAQGWWKLRLRFERTFRALTEPNYTWDPDDLISISPDLPLLRQLEKELTQVTFAKNPTMKLVINKTPDGQRSPNLGDAVMQCYHPAMRGPMIISREAVARGRRGVLPQAVHRPAYAGGGMYAARGKSRLGLTGRTPAVPPGASTNDY